MSTLDIAVCGSGIGGLAAAVAMRNAGHNVTIFEKVAVPRPVGSGLVLQPTGQAALARLGLLSTALIHSRMLRGIAGHTRAGRTIFDIDYASLEPDLFGLGIHRGTLFHILDRERECLSIPVIASTDITSSSISRDKRLIADATGTPRGAYDLVIDATGLHSPLRTACATIVLDKPYAYGAVWGVVCEPAEWPHKHTLTQRYDGAKIMVGLLPIGLLPGTMHPLTAFFWSLRTRDLASWRSTDFTSWQNQVKALWPAAAPFVDQFSGHDDLAAASYADVWLKAPYADRLAFVGDSARAASPQLGQGANLALIDAVILADCLTEHAAVNDALAAYRKYRRNHTRFYGLASRWLTPFFQSDSRLAAAVRDVSFAPMARVPYLRREMIRTLAGLKTGLVTHQTPNGLVGLKANQPVPTARVLPEKCERGSDRKHDKPSDVRPIVPAAD
jgi:salicylate hydroxylase